MTYEELKQLAAGVDDLQGWDFSHMRTERDPVPWNYRAVVRDYLRPTNAVLDIGTGGGEHFLALAPAFGHGIGIDVDRARVQTAQRQRPPAWRDHLTFEVMDGHHLRFADATFDVVLNRHAPIVVQEVARVLRAEGYFITQQVAPGNMQNFAMEFGGPATPHRVSLLPALSAAFAAHGCRVVAQATYTVRYFVHDVASLIFWLKAVCNPVGMEVPEAFDIEKHWRVLDRIITTYHTSRGIETTESRELLIVQKRTAAATRA
jgi:SAM-dependent methyltransferase